MAHRGTFDSWVCAAVGGGGLHEGILKACVTTYRLDGYPLNKFNLERPDGRAHGLPSSFTYMRLLAPAARLLIGASRVYFCLLHTLGLLEEYRTRRPSRVCLRLVALNLPGSSNT